LKEIANELSNRLIKLWLRNEKGERPFELAFGNSSFVRAGLADRTATQPSPQATARQAASPTDRGEDRRRYLFHEYFHGDTGAGLGASHQTGWTGLVAKLIQQQGEFGTIGTDRQSRSG
jgi:hypothetical protein